MCREICNDIESPFLTEHTLENRVGEVLRVAAKITWYVKTVGAAHITHQLCQPVLVEVDHRHALWPKSQSCLDERGTYGAGTSNHTHLPLI